LEETQRIIHEDYGDCGMAFNGVYLLDNDHSVIESVKETVSWRTNGFDVIGYNTDLEKAVAEITALKPVLVIYEWRVGGVTFMQRLRAAGVECEFIILTDYESFTALRNFFLTGGFDYLLKPLDKHKAETALARFRSLRSGQSAPHLNQETKRRKLI